ncbi:MAG: tRNA pseudouridine(38-40) synthase TruA [Chloroflexi bacterium]|nr:tRNA pseudouridine(38-40) synthase TruA [Chloroflexota bacterium]
MNAAVRLALLVEYDGTAYCGFQLQRAGQPTVQGALERAIERLTGNFHRIAAASRTDAGVHARGQVVSFLTDFSLEPAGFRRGLNTFLPADIAVQAAAQVPEGFHPRRDALSRRYRYRIVNRDTPAPLKRRWAHWVRPPLDRESMAQAAARLGGTWDWASFSGPPQRSWWGTVRTVRQVQVGSEGEDIWVEVEADSFLPQQVRRMAGALLQVGLGRMELSQLQDLLLRPRLGAARWTAPPGGLCLLQVNYKEEIFGERH